MLPAIKLSRNEKLCFMKALYSVFYRDSSINKTEADVLISLGQYLGVQQQEYKYLVSPEEVAIIINSISDPRARIYFMVIIKEVYKKENTLWPTLPPWLEKPDDFKDIYSILERIIIFK